MTNLLNRSVFVINATYEPLTVVSARRALKLLFKGSAVVEEVSSYVVHAGKLSIPLPDVIRLVKYRKVPRLNWSVSRKGILLRDQLTCQYCAEKFPAGDLTLDHVIPRSKGGGNTWENLVSSCKPCNNRKDDQTLEQAGMTLLRQPRQITGHAKIGLMAGADSVWERYMFN